MLETFRVRADVRERVPAIAHLDSSARVQTIRPAGSDGRLALVLTEFFRLTGVPMICNTSLNHSGEPIIESGRDAFNFALKKGIEIVYVHGVRFHLHNHSEYIGYSPGIRSRDWFRVSVHEATEMTKLLNPHGLNRIELYLYASNPDLVDAVDITTSSGAARIRRLTRLQMQVDKSVELNALTRIAKNSSYFGAFGSYPLMPEPRFTS